MSDIETRLREALTARAELVRPEDLTRGTPESEPRLPWWRHPGTYLVAAARIAVATVSAVALVVGSSDQAGRRPDLTHSPSPTPTPTTAATVTIPDSWDRAPQPPAGKQWSADVDGDGQPDQVTVTDGTALSVTTANGSLGTSVEGAEVSVGGLVTLPGSATPVITVQAGDGAAGTVYTQWHLFVVRDGKLVELRAPRSPYFGNQESDVTGLATYETWLTTDTGAPGEIFTMQYVDQGTQVDGSAYPGSGDTAYRVRVWHWAVDGTALRPESLGEACVVPPSRAIVDCP